MNISPEKPRDYNKLINKLKKSFINSACDFLAKLVLTIPPLKRYEKQVHFVVAVVFVGLLVFSFLLSLILGMAGLFDLQSKNTVISPIPNAGNPVVMPINLSEGKVHKALQDGCNTSNNFETNIWDVTAMRVIEIDPDTGDPLSYGVQQNNSFQSLMVYKVQCSLPLIATVSAELQSKNSFGLVFEYDNVLQVIVGDGDVRSVRYKVHKEEKRQFGWEYIRGKDGKKITHWLPENQKVAAGTETGLTVSIGIAGNGKIEISVGLSYKPIGGGYTNLVFPPVQVETYKYDTVTNIGRYIRVGLNDYSFEGAEAIIAPLRFSITKNKL